MALALTKAALRHAAELKHASDTAELKHAMELALTKAHASRTGCCCKTATVLARAEQNRALLRGRLY